MDMYDNAKRFCKMCKIPKEIYKDALGDKNDS